MLLSAFVSCRGRRATQNNIALTDHDTTLFSNFALHFVLFLVKSWHSICFLTTLEHKNIADISMRNRTMKDLAPGAGRVLILHHT